MPHLFPWHEIVTYGAWNNLFRALKIDSTESFITTGFSLNERNSSPLVPLSIKPLLSSFSASTWMLFVQVLCLAGSRASLINNLAAAPAITGSDGVVVLIQPDSVSTAVTKHKCKLTWLI